MLSLLLSAVLSISYTIDISKAPLVVPNDLTFREPVVITVTSFTDSDAQKFEEGVEKAHETGQQIIPVVVDSYGGSVYGLLHMIDTIKASRLPFATIVKGKAMSAGAVLASFGAEGHRYAAPNSTLLIHDVFSYAEGKAHDIKATSDEVQRLNKLLFKYLANNCGKPDNYFLKIVRQKDHADWFITPQEALKHNLVNKIKIPKLTTKVTTTLRLE